MPLFGRPDGTLVPDVGLIRRIMPFLMPTRTESMVLYEHVLDMTETLPFIDRYNAEHEQKISVFHIVLAAIARSLLLRPGLCRFVSGGRLYQQKDTYVSFSVKKEFKDDAPIVTVKLRAIPDEPLEETVARVYKAVHQSRGVSERPIDKEVRLALLFPGFMVRLFFWLARALDSAGLLPLSMSRNDPMYCSMFVANLGSVGVDRVYHHLYEYGTCGLFCCIGVVGKLVVPGPNDQPVVKTCLRLRYTFDERINDGHYCIGSLGLVKKYTERPELLSQPETAEPETPEPRPPRRLELS